VKRLSIDVKNVEFTSEGNVFVTDARDIRFWLCTGAAAERLNLTVEDILDPLPTEPGERFWGRTKYTEPQWWFVREGADTETWYVPAGRVPASLCVDEIPANGLVRLPEPTVIHATRKAHE